MKWIYLAVVLIWIQPTGEWEHYAKNVKAWYKTMPECTRAFEKIKPQLEKLLRERGATEIETYGFCKAI